MIIVTLTVNNCFLLTLSYFLYLIDFVINEYLVKIIVIYLRVNIKTKTTTDEKSFTYRR